MPNGNIFDSTLRTMAELFAPYLAGSFGGLAIAVGTTWPNETVRNALESSLAALGYGNDCLAYVSLTGSNGNGKEPVGGSAQNDEGANNTADQGEPMPLDAHALFTLAEGLDPRCIIALDSQASRTLAEAFHVKHILNAHARFSGRDVVAFSDFASLMNSPEDKQRAWRLLKKLPKLN